MAEVNPSVSVPSRSPSACPLALLAGWARALPACSSSSCPSALLFAFHFCACPYPTVTVNDG